VWGIPEIGTGMVDQSHVCNNYFLFVPTNWVYLIARVSLLDIPVHTPHMTYVSGNLN
jgi:hypothetical protein